MDAFDRCHAKLDDLNAKVTAGCDSIISDLCEIRQYNRNTALIVMVLWGIGLPLVIFASVIYAARHAYQ